MLIKEINIGIILTVEELEEIIKLPTQNQIFPRKKLFKTMMTGRSEIKKDKVFCLMKKQKPSSKDKQLNIWPSYFC